MMYVTYSRYLVSWTWSATEETDEEESSKTKKVARASIQVQLTDLDILHVLGTGAFGTGTISQACDLSRSILGDNSVPFACQFGHLIHDPFRCFGSLCRKSSKLEMLVCKKSSKLEMLGEM
jgi:hypothetical protein